MLGNDVQLADLASPIALQHFVAGVKQVAGGKLLAGGTEFLVVVHKHTPLH
ncbi:hypothetical protein D3C74_503610 [compost metagenome]